MSAAEKAEKADKSQLGVALDFMRLLWALDHGLQRRSKRMEVELGVTGMQRIIIRLIGAIRMSPPAASPELVHVHPSTLTGVLKRLVDRGFIKRERDGKDARISRFTLLPSGTEIDATQAGTVEAAVRRALARIDPAAVESARTVLAVVAEELSREDR